jgi:selenocysteine lyase/cysteine desulfurase
MNVEKVREDFPITNEVVYLNVANHSPPSRPVQDAIRGFLEDWDRLARHGDMRVEEACRSFAHLIGADPCEVVGQPNTSAGLSIVAESLPLERGMNVVTNDLENPANVYPWLAQRRKGIEVRIIKGEGGAVRIEDIERAVDDQTGALTISHVQWLTGARSDLDAMAEIAHDHSAYLVVDGIQSIGSLQVDVRRDDVDFLACGSYKWLLGPSGAGFLYAREELIKDLEPPFIGYRAVEGHSLKEPKLKGTAQRLELGEPSYLSFVGTGAAIDLILDVGPIAIEKRVLKLSGLLFEGLLGLGVEIVSPSDKGLRSGVMSFTTGDDRGLYESLNRVGFVVSLRPAGIHVSPDFYNTEDEVERFVEHVRKSIH